MKQSVPISKSLNTTKYEEDNKKIIQINGYILINLSQVNTCLSLLSNKRYSEVNLSSSLQQKLQQFQNMKSEYYQQSITPSYHYTQQHDNNFNQYTTIRELIPLEEFVELSNQIKVQAERRQNLIDSLYTPNYYQREFKYKRSEQKQLTPYQQLYQSWKQQQQKECTFDSTYKSTLALLDKQKRQSQLKRLISENKMSEPIYKYQQENPYLKTKSTIHQNTLKQTFKTQLNFNKQPERKQNDSSRPISSARDSRQKQRNISAAVQMQLLRRITEINRKQQQQQQRRLKQKQMQKTCFVDFIQRPNLILERKNDPKQAVPKKQVPKEQIPQIKQPIYEEVKIKLPKKQKKNAYKLNIQEILKIKPKQYLIFYSDNYHQILRLASPEQMKQLNNYRDQCLKKQEALAKLKQKISQFGPQYIQKLPSSSREKLFRLLYQQDLDIQKKYNS